MSLVDRLRCAHVVQCVWLPSGTGLTCSILPCLSCLIVPAVYDCTLNFRNNENPTLLGVLNGKKYHADCYVRWVGPASLLVKGGLVSKCQIARSPTSRNVCLASLVKSASHRTSLQSFIYVMNSRGTSTAHPGEEAFPPSSCGSVNWLGSACTSPRALSGQTGAQDSLSTILDGHISYEDGSALEKSHIFLHSSSVVMFSYFCWVLLFARHGKDSCLVCNIRLLSTPVSQLSGSSRWA